MATHKSASLESDLQALDKIVQDLEAQDLNIEDSLKQFEAGIKLVRQCQKAIDTAEQKVNRLTESNQIIDESDA